MNELHISILPNILGTVLNFHVLSHKWHDTMINIKKCIEGTLSGNGASQIFMAEAQKYPNFQF